MSSGLRVDDEDLTTDIVSGFSLDNCNFCVVTVCCYYYLRLSVTSDDVDTILFVLSFSQRLSTSSSMNVTWLTEVTIKKREPKASEWFLLAFTIGCVIEFLWEVTVDTPLLRLLQILAPQDRKVTYTKSQILFLKCRLGVNLYQDVVLGTYPKSHTHLWRLLCTFWQTLRKKTCLLEFPDTLMFSIFDEGMFFQKCRRVIFPF